MLGFEGWFVNFFAYLWYAVFRLVGNSMKNSLNGLEATSHMPLKLSD